MDRKAIPNEKQNKLKWSVPKSNLLDIHQCSVSLLEDFMSDDLIDLFVDQTNIYVKLKGNTSLSIRSNEIRLFLAILITSGYSILPQKRLHWPNDVDVNNKAINSVMS